MPNNNSNNSNLYSFSIFELQSDFCFIKRTLLVKKIV